MAERKEEPITGETAEPIPPVVQGRVLALEIRSGKMGFAVFEKMELINWGTRYFVRKTNSLSPYASARIRDLLSTYHPALIVGRERKYFFAPANKRIVMILEALRKEARHQPAKVTMLTARSVERHFGILGCTTKHQIATNVARQFELLSWNLPKPRKVYESEAPIMTVFDAVATGLTFLEKNADTPINS